MAEQIRHLTLIAIPNPGEEVQDAVLEPPVEPLVLRRPEVAAVLSRAVSAVADELGLGAQAPPRLIRELEHAAAIAMADAYEPIADTASRLRISAVNSRTTEAASVRKRAEQLAAVVSETASALQQRNDELAESMAAAAMKAARVAAASSVPGHKLEARRRAVQDAKVIRAAATARADQRAAAATLVASAARQAAVRLASETERAAVIVERDAFQAAGVIQSAALDMAYDVAVDAACRHVGASRGLT